MANNCALFVTERTDAALNAARRKVAGIPTAQELRQRISAIRPPEAQNAAIVQLAANIDAYENSTRVIGALHLLTGRGLPKTSKPAVISAAQSSQAAFTDLWEGLSAMGIDPRAYIMAEADGGYRWRVAEHFWQKGLLRTDPIVNVAEAIVARIDERARGAWTDFSARDGGAHKSYAETMEQLSTSTPEQIRAAGMEIQQAKAGRLAEDEMSDLSRGLLSFLAGVEERMMMVGVAVRKGLVNTMPFAFRREVIAKMSPDEFWAKYGANRIIGRDVIVNSQGYEVNLNDLGGQTTELEIYKRRFWAYHAMSLGDDRGNAERAFGVRFETPEQYAAATDGDGDVNPQMILQRINGRVQHMADQAGLAMAVGDAGGGQKPILNQLRKIIADNVPDSERALPFTKTLATMNSLRLYAGDPSLLAVVGDRDLRVKLRTMTDEELRTEALATIKSDGRIATYRGMKGLLRQFYLVQTWLLSPTEGGTIAALTPGKATGMLPIQQVIAGAGKQGIHLARTIGKSLEAAAGNKTARDANMIAMHGDAVNANRIYQAQAARMGDDTMTSSGWHKTTQRVGDLSFYNQQNQAANEASKSQLLARAVEFARAQNANREFEIPHDFQRLVLSGVANEWAVFREALRRADENGGDALEIMRQNNPAAYYAFNGRLQEDSGGAVGMKTAREARSRPGWRQRGKWGGEVADTALTFTDYVTVITRRFFRRYEALKEQGDGAHIYWGAQMLVGLIATGVATMYIRDYLIPNKEFDPEKDTGRLLARGLQYSNFFGMAADIASVPFRYWTRKGPRDPETLVGMIVSDRAPGFAIPLEMAILMAQGLETAYEHGVGDAYGEQDIWRLGARTWRSVGPSGFPLLRSPLAYALDDWERDAQRGILAVMAGKVN